MSARLPPKQPTVFTEIRNQRAPVGPDGVAVLPISADELVDLSLVSEKSGEITALSGMDLKCPQINQLQLRKLDLEASFDLCPRIDGAKLPASAGLRQELETSQPTTNSGFASFARENITIATSQSSAWVGIPESVNTEASITWSWPENAAIDLRHGFLSFWIRVEHLENASVYMNFSDSDSLKNSVEYSLTAGSQAQPFLEEGVWLPMTLNPQLGRQIGRKITDFGKIRMVRIRLMPKGLPLATLHITPVIPHQSSDSEPLAIVTFDDGIDSVFSTALTAMQRRKIPGVAYIIYEYLGRRGRLTTPQLEIMQREYGWDIAGHADGFLTDLNAEDLRVKLTGVRSFLIDHGFFSGAFHFAYPHGEYDDTRTPHVREIVSSIFDSARGIFEGSAETSPPADFTRLRVIYVVSVRR
jgi:hypothetical protein